MATGSQPDSVFYGVYDKYVGDARTKPEVYGYWILVLGLLAAVAGAVVFVLARTGVVGLSPAGAAEIAAVLGASGVAGLLLGFVMQLPLRRRAIHVAILGSMLSVGAAGYFTQIYPDAWGLGSNAASLAVAVTYVGGLAVVVLVAALTPIVTGRRSLFLAAESADELAWRVDVEDDDAAERVSDVLVGKATRDGVFAVFPDGDGWRWWFVEQAAVADGRQQFERADTAEAALEDVKAKVGSAGLLEVTHAAFRLYRDDDDSVRWALVDEDGVVLADSDGTYGDRQTAEDGVNLLKEYGPDATLLEVDDGAFEVYGDGETWYWRLVDEHRTALGEGPTGYDERGDAEVAVRDVRDLIVDAAVMDVDHLGFEFVRSEGGSDRDGEGEWAWRLVDAADEVVATSTETFESRAAAESAVGRVAEGAIDVPFLTATAPGYEVVEADDGGWCWRLVDDEDQVVARSEGAVPSEESGRTVVGRLQDVVADADVLELDDAEFEVFPDGDEWAWRLVSEDRRTIARSPKSVTFDDPTTARAAIDRVVDDVESPDRIEFEGSAFHLYEADDGAWNWRLVDGDGSVVSDSGQQHASREDAAAAMNTMKQHAPDADLVEIDSPVLELYEADDEWHWRLVDAAGETLAVSPRRYESADVASDVMDTFELLAPGAETREMAAAVFQVYVSDTEPRRWKWRLIHPDGAVVATSEDGFADREAATAAATDVAGYAAEATVHTIDDLAIRFDVESDEEAGEDRWRWQLVDADRTELAAGTQTYPSRDAVAETARLVRDHAGAASLFEVDPSAFRLDETEAGWHWRLIDPDRETIAVGARHHEERADAMADVERVRDLGGDADLLDFDLAAFEVIEGDAGWRWQFVDSRGTVVGASGPRYDSRDEAEAALRAVRDALPAASLLEFESPAFELHEDDSAWRWRLIDTDGSTVAESMRTYPTRREAREALDGMRSFGGDAATEIAD